MYKQLEKYYLYLYNTVDVLIRTNKVVAMRLDEVKNNTNAEILNYFAQEKPKAFGTHYYLVKEGSHWEIGELNALHWLAKKITGLLGLGNIFYKKYRRDSIKNDFKEAYLDKAEVYRSDQLLVSIGNKILGFNKMHQFHKEKKPSQTNAGCSSKVDKTDQDMAKKQLQLMAPKTNSQHLGDGLKKLKNSFTKTGYKAGRDFTFKNHPPVRVYQSSKHLNFVCNKQVLAVKLNSNGTISHVRLSQDEYTDEKTFPEEIQWVKLVVASHCQGEEILSTSKNTVPSATPLQNEAFDKGSFVTLMAVMEIISGINLYGGNSRKMSEMQVIAGIDNPIYEYINGSKLMHIIKALDYNRLNRKFYELTTEHGNRFSGRKGEKNYVVSRKGKTITISDANKQLVFSYDIDPKTGNASNYKNANGKCKKDEINWDLNKSAMFALIPKNERERQRENALRFEFNGENYYVWHNQQFLVVEAQTSIAEKIPTNKLGLKVGKDGLVTSLQVNVEKPIPIKSTKEFEEYLNNNPEKSQLLYAALKQGFIVSSQYKLNKSWNNRLYADIVRSGIKKFPHILLDLFMQEINKMHREGDKDPYMTTHFMLDDLSVEKGIDDTGLTRDFISELAEAMCQHLGFLTDKTTHLYYPSENKVLSEEKKEMYTQFGQLLKLCHNTKQSFVSGVLLDDSIFYTICSLSYKTIAKKSYQDLEDDEKFTLFNKLIETANSSETANASALQKQSQILALYFKDSWTPDDYKKAEEYIELVGDEDELPSEPEPEDIQNQFMITVSDDPKIQKIEGQAEAVFYIAKGFLKLANPGSLQDVDIEDAWTSFNYLSQRDVKLTITDKIQGCIDRKAFDDYFKISNDPQIKRLRDVIVKWVKDPKTTDQEIKKMLQNLSGSTAIVKGKTYEFKPYNYSDIFDTHTCYFYTNVNVEFLKQIEDDKELLNLFKSMYVDLGSIYNKA